MDISSDNGSVFADIDDTGANAGGIGRRGSTAGRSKSESNILNAGNVEGVGYGQSGKRSEDNNRGRDSLPTPPASSPLDGVD